MTDSKDAADLVAAVVAEIRRRVDGRIWTLASQPGPDNIDAAALRIDAAALRFHCAALLGTDASPAAVAYAELAARDKDAAVQVIIGGAAQVTREREPRPDGRLDHDRPDQPPVQTGRPDPR